MSTAAITIKQLEKNYGPSPVLEQLELSLVTGEFVGLVGENGAGKTTLINCILDFCSINAGNIHIFNVDHHQTKARERLTYLPEKFSPPYFMTGLDYLKYMAGLHDVQFNTRAVEQCLTELDLDKSALHKPVKHYSKGMGQKLGLAACFLSNKELMIFDEPMSGLDPKARALLKRYLLQLKKQNKTLFYSTHLLEDVEALCDRVLILHDGQICFTGTTDECCSTFHAPDFESAYLVCVNR